MKKDRTNIYIWGFIGVVVILGLYVYFTSGSAVVPPGKYDTFAQCLASKDIIMYGAEWCPHCKDQKLAFGTSFQYVKYVECPDNQALCDAKGVTGYPTWIFPDGSFLVGFQKLSELAAKSGCELPQD